MEKGRVLARWNVILTAVVAGSLMVSSPAVFGVATQPATALEFRADIISIDSMKVFGKLERPPVTFFHQKHTAALEKSGKDCTACHLAAKDPAQDVERMSPLYMRLKTPPSKT